MRIMTYENTGDNFDRLRDHRICVWRNLFHKERKKIIDIGPIEATKEEKKTIPLPPILGGLLVVGGLLFL